jgi:hypothetical protein
MKFKVEENLPSEVATDLAAAGHDSQTVFEEGLAGSADPILIDAAHRERRVLLTMDKGIADVRSYPPDQYDGIILFRPKTQGRGATLAFVRRHLPALLPPTSPATYWS